MPITLTLFQAEKFFHINFEVLQHFSCLLSMDTSVNFGFKWRMKIVQVSRAIRAQ
jgi:hypothetical protein